MTALLTLEEIKAHLRVDHDADDDMLMDKVRQATAVLLAYIQGSRDKVIREDGELIPGEALTRMKGAAMRLTGMLYRNPDPAVREALTHGALPLSVSVRFSGLGLPPGFSVPLIYQP
ncbi:DNA-packaging protein, partial [Escherichia coli]|uniref:head-tail connector protein n=1 Tax=Escherichia coli TaxID=562 RepID=UPI00068298B4